MSLNQKFFSQNKIVIASVFSIAGQKHIPYYLTLILLLLLALIRAIERDFTISLTKIVFYFVHQIDTYMKTKLTSLLLIVVVSSTTMSFTNQQKLNVAITKAVMAGNFGSFNVHRMHNSAALRWGFNSTEVSSFIIQRSYDGTYFSTIDQQAPATDHWNKYTDNTVEPGFIYYRLIAVMNDGSEEYSAVEMLRIVRHK